MLPISERRRRSAREWFANCRHAYAATYVHGLTTDSNATRRGSCFHDARHRYINELWRKQYVSDHELAQIALTQACVEHPLPYDEWQDVRDLWARWSERYELNLTTFFSVEQAIAGPFGADLRLDEVHVPGPDTIRAIDAKTWWRIPSQAEMVESFQTRYYLAAMRRVFPGFRRYEIQYEIVRYSTLSEVITADDGDLDEFEEYIAEQDISMASAEESADYPATAGAHCAYCVATCPIVDHPFGGARRVDSHECAGGVVRVLAALHHTVEGLTAILRGYSEQHGRVESGGIEWAFRPTERHVYPAQAVLDVLEQHGTPFKLMLSGTAVKPLLTSKKKYAHLADDIRALAQTKVTTKFYPKRTAPADDDRAYDDEVVEE
jgi:hypothetical protein